MKKKKKRKEKKEKKKMNVIETENEVIAAGNVCRVTKSSGAKVCYWTSCYSEITVHLVDGKRVRAVFDSYKHMDECFHALSSFLREKETGNIFCLSRQEGYAGTEI